ncbi:MAG: Anti-sigma factor antagonist [Bacteroidota bacterium]|jgi:stage II sporulation protein AA (anti-sigma F factor antagonist)
MIKIGHRTLAEIALFDLSGRMIGDAGNEFAEAASLQIVDFGFRKLVLNLRNLEQCDSMGISVLLRIHRSLENMGGKMVICNVNDLISKVFSLIHINEVFHISANERDALEEFGVAAPPEEEH